MHLDYPRIVSSTFRIIYLFNALISCIHIGIHIDSTVSEAIQSIPFNLLLRYSDCAGKISSNLGCLIAVHTSRASVSAPKYSVYSHRKQRETT